MTELEFAKHMITTYLGETQTPDSLYDLMELKSGNKKILLGHLKALADVFSEAKKQLEKEMENDNR